MNEKATAEQKKARSVLNTPKRRELAKILITQTKEIEELKTEKGMLLNKLNCENGSEVATLKKHILQMEMALHQYEKQEKNIIQSLTMLLQNFLIQKKMHEMLMNLNLLRNAYAQDRKKRRNLTSMSTLAELL